MINSNKNLDNPITGLIEPRGGSLTFGDFRDN